MMKPNKKLLKSLLFILLVAAIVYFSVFLFSYNSPKKVENELSGIFIDYDSSIRGVSVNKIHIDSIDEVNPGKNSTYWFGCTFNNYTPPVYLEVYFPFDIEITSYGSCKRPINIKNGITSVGDEECCEFDARVVDGHILQIIFDDAEVPYEQLQISANIFSTETPDRYVFKSFKIKSNPLPFTKKGNLVFQNNNIDYSIKIKRNEYNVELSESNFIPEIRNEITGNFDYERIYWESKNTPVESILYISDIEQTRFKTLLNLFGILLLGIFLGLLFEKIFGKINL